MQTERSQNVLEVAAIFSNAVFCNNSQNIQSRNWRRAIHKILQVLERAKWNLSQWWLSKQTIWPALSGNLLPNTETAKLNRNNNRIGIHYLKPAQILQKNLLTVNAIIQNKRKGEKSKNSSDLHFQCSDIYSNLQRNDWTLTVCYYKRAQSNSKKNLIAQNGFSLQTLKSNSVAASRLQCAVRWRR